ncbi:hypothetical protein [Micromonospora endolithica]|nr:hypothetical protein [Micromonospora endolithica]TWJ24833.1 hypothetical protein JD76_04989 [Micromonospora endolithica]
MWRILAGVGMCLTLTLVGVALATNFRGVTEWHVRRSMSAVSAARGVTPWRGPPDARDGSRTGP